MVKRVQKDPLNGRNLSLTGVQVYNILFINGPGEGHQMQRLTLPTDIEWDYSHYGHVMTYRYKCCAMKLNSRNERVYLYACTDY